MKKIRLNIAGLSYTQTQTGAYALILAEEKGPRRLPVIIGGAEAQSIAIHLEGLQPSRPLTHDLFLSLAGAYRIELIEVNIIRIEEGIFYSELVCKRKDAIVKIDARTSDAVSLAIRFRCPIYATVKVMRIAAVYIDKDGQLKPYSEDDEDYLNEEETEAEKLEQFLREHVPLSEKELQKRMNAAAEKEDYETASLIRDIIKTKNGENTDLDISEYL